MTSQHEAVSSSQLHPIHCVVLCGGSGSRLWPLSRLSFPKQFIPLLGDKSLLQLTLERLKGLGPISCVTAEAHRFFVADAAELAGVDVQQLLEPQPRNTAAAMAIAALSVDPDSTLLFCPSDHYIPDHAAFQAMVTGALGLALAGQIVTFGVLPTQPSTAYGYIQQGDALTSVGWTVKRFVEKPDAARAAALLAEGGYLWNAGIFLMKAATLLAGLAQHAPDILAQCQQAMKTATIDGRFVRPGADAFAACRSESIDYALMERASGVAVVPFSGAWSDVGSWTAVADLASDVGEGNRAGGQTANAHFLGARNTYIHASGRPVVALGTQGLLIVDTPDALLVADRGHAESVKAVVAKLEALDAHEAIHHRRVARPWGWYDTIDAGHRFQVKRITVKPGASLSLQLHHHRAEHWIVVQGTARVTRGDDTFLLIENQSTYIPLGERHRLHNPGKTALEMIEVQSGGYLGEDDIVRFDDSYGRA
jgi:mannose-1-phosphate guanylyltransferase / mannose-6-phosphate isomerase